MQDCVQYDCPEPLTGDSASQDPTGDVMAVISPEQQSRRTLPEKSILGRGCAELVACLPNLTVHKALGLIPSTDLKTGVGG